VGAVEYVSAASAAVFAGPTWRENGVEPPARSDRDPESFRSDLAALEERIRTMPGWRRRRILTGQFVDVRMHIVRRTVDDVISQLRRREATKAAFLELGGEIRRVHAELGRRLVHTGVVGQASDVELLSTSELVAALDGNLPLAPDVLRRRRNWLGRYDVEGQLPLRFRGIPDREPKPLPQGDVLSGWAASPGRQRGKVRIVREANGTFEAGEVLVAEATDASWSPLFMRAAAVVVERGGPLSHAAILARELGLPAVLNVDGATQVLAGCTVSVDGDQGMVVIEDRGGT
jgi:pyruvate,water dikinase